MIKQLQEELKTAKEEKETTKSKLDDIATDFLLDAQDDDGFTVPILTQIYNSLDARTQDIEQLTQQNKQLEEELKEIKSELHMDDIDFETVGQLKHYCSQSYKQLKEEKDALQKFYLKECNKLEQQNKQIMATKSNDCSMRFENEKGEFVGCLDHIAEINLDRKQMREALERWQEITNETGGIYGWHLNGDLSPWDEWDEIINMTDDAIKGGK